MLSLQDRKVCVENQPLRKRATELGIQGFCVQSTCPKNRQQRWRQVAGTEAEGRDQCI